MARYGIPWQGSKSRVAEWVVDVLPKSHTLVDLFGGGCAVTHCAILSGKWEHVIANDVTDSVKVFMDALRGEYNGLSTVPTREEFLASEDTAVRMLYSFGNDRKSYLWSPALEAVKVEASKMLALPSLHERRMAYKAFCRAMGRWLRNGDVNYVGKPAGNGMEDLQGLERLEGLEKLEKLQGLDGLERLDCLQCDYRLVDVPEGATVYADPPYRSTANSKRYGEFDHYAFDQWLNGVDFPVFVSEFDAPDGCVEIANTERITSMSATTTGKRIERIFVQERFADRYEAPSKTKESNDRK